MKKYFIHITYYQAKNDLDRELQEHFRTLDHNLISEQDTEALLQGEFDKICQLFKQSGKRTSLADFDKSTPEYAGSIRYTVGNRQGTNMYIDLLPILGDLDLHVNYHK